MNRRTVILGVLLGALCGCEQTPDEAPKQTAAPPPVQPTEPTFDFEPIEAREGLPVRVLDMRLRGEPIGTYRDREYPGGIPLQAIGLNLCQTGWVLQGFLRPESELVATPPLHIPLPVLPKGRTTSPNPESSDRSLVLDLERATMERLVGSVAIEATGEDAPQGPILRMEFDGAPVGVSTAPGLGGRGCFTTGYWQMEEGGDSLQGPVSAVWDQRKVHYVGLRLTEEYGIGVWLVLQPTHRQPENLIRADLARVGEKPKQYPLRVVFEHRKKSDSGMYVDEIAATEGEVNAAFTRANPQGPLRIELSDLKFPDWAGPMAGETVDAIRVEALLVTDPNGRAVPVPTSPSFEGPKKEPERP